MLTFLGLGYFGTPNLPKKVFLFNPLFDFKKGVTQSAIMSFTCYWQMLPPSSGMKPC
jgi:hypothetical protein